MKKYEKYIYVAIAIILVGVILSGTTYIILKDNKTEINEDNKPNKKEPILLKDGVELKKTYNLNDKIIQEYDIVLNNKKNSINITFNYEEHNEIDDGQVLNLVSGTLNNQLIFGYGDYAAKKNDVFNTTIIKNKFNEKNFKIIKGIDNKNYLLLIANTEYDYDDVDLYIFNDNFEQIKNNFDNYAGGCDKKDNMTIIAKNSRYVLENNQKPWYNNSFNVDLPNSYNINVKLENNQIYYLYPLLNYENDAFNENDYGTIEERIYTINNNKLEYKVNKAYKIAEAFGQVC